MQAPHLFLPYQPAGTTGLARRLNPNVHYIAMSMGLCANAARDAADESALVRSPCAPASS